MRTALTAAAALAFALAAFAPASEACCGRCGDTAGAPAPVATLSRDDLNALLASDTRPTVVDVLPPEAYNKAHIQGAINIPLESLESLAGNLDKNAAIVTTCAGFKCPASTRAAEKLKALGFLDVRDYKGGIQDWTEAGLPVEKGDFVRFITRDDLTSLRESRKEFVLVDVLAPESYGKAHIAGAISIPLADLERRAGELDKDATIVVYCYNYICRASTMAATTLNRLGFKDVRDYKGGVFEWKRAGLPLEGTDVKPPAVTAGPAGPTGAPASPAGCAVCPEAAAECPPEAPACCPEKRVDP
jgi:rhodanese-related sulfurtransferase